jgi:DNA-binding transcriptional MerR regulator
MEKSADAFRTISEVADSLALPQHVLRFWESRFPQIKPLKRAGGRRYYRPGDVDLLRAIRRLLYDDGYTIKGVQRLLKERGAKGLGVAGGGDLHLPDAPTQIDGISPEPAVPEDSPDSSSVEAMEEPGLGHAQRQGIATALDAIEECERILGALHRPSF